MNTRVVEYNRIGDDTTRKEIGLIAQEFNKIYHIAVSSNENETEILKDGEDPWGIDYSKIVPLLIKSTQEQQTEIEELKRILKDNNLI